MTPKELEQAVNDFFDTTNCKKNNSIDEYFEFLSGEEFDKFKKLFGEYETDWDAFKSDENKNGKIHLILKIGNVHLGTWYETNSWEGNEWYDTWKLVEPYQVVKTYYKDVK